MSFAIGFTLGIILGFLIFGLDYPSVWICIIVGKYKFEQGSIYKAKNGEWVKIWN